MSTFYVIEKNGLYFNSGLSGWVESSGICDTPSWGELFRSWSTTSLDLANKVAMKYGGTVTTFSDTF